MKITKSAKLISITIILLILFILLQINSCINSKITELKVNTKIHNQTNDTTPPSSHQQKTTGSVTKKIHLDPSRKFELHIFTQEKTEIARYKTHKNKIFDMSGTIPDGKVTFTNDATKTYGEEYYINQKKDDWAKEYYQNTQLKKETYYDAGNIVISREFYNDGTLRMEEDYSDAIRFNDDRETGIGKVYHRDGTIKYEWQLTYENNGGFKKSYNKEAQPVQEIYFDINGNPIEK